MRYADVCSMVQLCGDSDAPNLLASVLQLEDGLEARSVNCWPNVDVDVGVSLRLLSGIIPAGFYYKTFFWPHWHVFEPVIRKLAGFGKPPRTVPDRPYENRYDHCDVMIVGAGPTGLAAALAAGRAGARVLLVDDMVRPGGGLLRSAAVVDGKPADQWVHEAVDEIDALANVVRLQEATAWGYLEGNLVTIMEHRPEPSELMARNRKVWAKHVVLATGAMERPIVFGNNDRPGVMLVSAVSDYIHNYAVLPGKRAVVFTNNDGAYRTLLDLSRAGAEIAAVVDVRENVPAHLLKLVDGVGLRMMTDSYIGTVRGSKRVQGVEIRSCSRSDVVEYVNCDLVCVSGGWNPLVHLFSQSGGKLKFCERIQSFVPDTVAQETSVVGAANGSLQLDRCLNEGSRAGSAAAASVGYNGIKAPNFDGAEPFDIDDSIEAFWNVPAGRRSGKTFVDMAGDVTVADLELSVREGYGAIEHLKRYTTTGMGLDQGKTANVNAIGIVAGLTGKEISQVGTTTFRPPYVPIEFGAIAGSRSDSVVLPYRHTPITRWHVSKGAVIYEAGARWQRPGFYPKYDETMEQAVARECRSVREGVGIYDGSPLAKFEIKGPDVEKLLDLVYTNSFSRLRVHQGRYGIMLTEDGLIFDDGVTFRVADDLFLMSGATGNGPALEAKLDRLIHIERPDLRVLVTPVTSQWANATVCGPIAREMLKGANCSIDLSADAFPFMHMREGNFAGMPVRIFRVSFTGELSFEINTSARYGLQLWEYLMELGSEFGICPVGSEANHVLRVEKGFISLAHEVDGTADPIDLGLDWIVSKNKSDFIGQRAMEIRRQANNDRRELVGLLPNDPSELIPENAPITPGGRATDSEGFVSASVWSIALDRFIALGLLERGRKRIGETVFIRHSDRIIPAEVVEPVFYDPAGKKLRM